MSNLIRVTGFLLAVTLIFPAFNARAQGNVQCGSIIEGELTVDNNEHYYTLELAAGDSLQFSVDPLGDTLDVVIDLATPAGEWLDWTSNERNGGTEEFNSPVLSASGTYTIYVGGRWSEDIGILLCTLAVHCVTVP